ncbi:unnamed protein product [Caenorhabditis sp. 36 PRJEB53466]|nr:unnamed protein product [Caenorhabditis sp. 36 PRJEB53466]
MASTSRTEEIAESEFSNSSKDQEDLLSFPKTDGDELEHMDWANEQQVQQMEQMQQEMQALRRQLEEAQKQLTKEQNTGVRVVSENAEAEGKRLRARVSKLLTEAEERKFRVNEVKQQNEELKKEIDFLKRQSATNTYSRRDQGRRVPPEDNHRRAEDFNVS